MHAHSVLMLAAAGVIWLFVAVVVAATWLRRHGRLGTEGERRSVRDFGPILAAACSGGAAAIHVGVVSAHAAQTAAVAATASGAPIAFLCSLGAGSSHFTAVGANAATFLPLGVLSIGLVPFQGAFAVPAMWRRATVARAGVLVGLVAVGLALAQQLLVPIARVADSATAAGVAATATGSGISDGIALVFEIALLLVAALLIWGRPQRLAARLEVSSLDAWIGTALAVGSVVIFGATAILATHAVH